MSNQETSLSNVVSDDEKVNDVNNSEVKETKAKNTKPKKPAGFWVLLLLIVLVVGAGAAAGYYFWEQQQKQAGELQKQQTAIVFLQSELKKATKNINRNVQGLANNTAFSADLKKQILQTQSISQQAISIVNRNQRDWAIAEIDYLLRIAHQRIAVAKDIGGAIAALKGADDRLEQLGDLTLFKIRKQLAKDIGSLNAIHQADVNGISLTLDQAIANLPELPFKSVKDEIKVQFTENDAVEQPVSEDKTFVDSIMETVRQIGDIKVHQRSIQAASSGEQQNQIEQLLRTYLLGARLAALRFDQTQFLHEIGQASEIVRLHYDEKDNRIQQLEKILLEYSALQLSPDLPELTKAWVLLQKEIKTPTKKTVKSAVEKINPKPKAKSQAKVKTEVKIKSEEKTEPAAKPIARPTAKPTAKPIARPTAKPTIIVKPANTQTDEVEVATPEIKQ